MREQNDTHKDAATRQEDWRNQEREKESSRRFDRRVTEEEYRALYSLLQRLRET